MLTLRSPLRLMAGMVACLGVLWLTPGVASAAGTPVEETRADGTIIESRFNAPPAGSTDHTITNHLRDLITDAHMHSDIRIALFSLSSTAIKDAIINETPARDGGAGIVKVVYDGTNIGVEGSVADQLRDTLEGDGDSRTQFIRCDRVTGYNDTAGGCLGSKTTSSQHAKYALISGGWKREGSAQGFHGNIVWMSSANATGNSGYEAYNNSVTVYNDEQLYNGLRDEIYDVQAAETWPSNDFYDYSPGNGYIHATDSNVSIFASPENTSGRDQWVERLNDITPGPGCSVAVMQAVFEDERSWEIAKKLESLRWPSWPSSSPQCNVYVLVGQTDTGAANMGTTVKDILCDDTKPIKDRVKSHPKIHDKSLIVSGVYNGSAKQIVFTGSHNFSERARDANDELLVRIGHGTGATYNRFASHFSTPYNSTSAKPLNCS
jgi:hypothetical protein